MHLFSQYKWAQEVWEILKKWFGLIIQAYSALEMLIQIKQKNWNKFEKELVLATFEAMIYHIWIARNQFVFMQIRVEKSFVVQ